MDTRSGITELGTGDTIPCSGVLLQLKGFLKTCEFTKDYNDRKKNRRKKGPKGELKSGHHAEGILQKQQ